MVNKEKFFEYVEEKLGQDYIVKYDDMKLEVGNDMFLVCMRIDLYSSKDDLLVKTYDNYYYFSVINDIMNKLNRYYKKFKD